MFVDTLFEFSMRLIRFSMNFYSNQRRKYKFIDLNIRRERDKPEVVKKQRMQFNWFFCPFSSAMLFYLPHDKSSRLVKFNRVMSDL